MDGWELGEAGGGAGAGEADAGGRGPGPLQHHRRPHLLLPGPHSLPNPDSSFQISHATLEIGKPACSEREEETAGA
eukprot:2940560-Rhodomonas_salina.1